jgi:hypothetical protein
LQILGKGIIISDEGVIIDYELNSPYEYLSTLASSFSGLSEEEYGSDQIRYRPS